MEREELLNRIRAERVRLDEALAHVPDERLLERDDVDTWTGKDHLAHLAAWQGVALARVTGAMPQDIGDVVRGEYTEETIDAINERLHQRARDMPADDVRFEFTSTKTGSATGSRRWPPPAS